MLPSQESHKRKINSLRKGKRGELLISKFLSYLTSKPWSRVPCSGALSTSKSHLRFSGDVYCDDPLYSSVSVEVKNHSIHVSVNDLFNFRSIFHSWLEQLSRELSDSGLGILFFKSGLDWFWLPLNRSCEDHVLLDLLHSVSRSCYGLNRLDKAVLKKSSLSVIKKRSSSVKLCKVGSQ